MTAIATEHGRGSEQAVETREILARLIEYALVEARREGETECACHLYQALDALTRLPDVIEWPPESVLVPRLVS